MRRVLFAVLVIVGLAMTAIGANTAFGGMTTLGWQFPPDFFTVTDASLFDRHDSNARFFGTVFMGFGLIMALTPLTFGTLGIVSAAFLLCIALGGIARLMQPGYAVYSDAALLPSLLAELIGAPILALWILRTRRSDS